VTGRRTIADALFDAQVRDTRMRTRTFLDFLVRGRSALKVDLLARWAPRRTPSLSPARRAPPRAWTFTPAEIPRGSAGGHGPERRPRGRLELPGARAACAIRVLVMVQGRIAGELPFPVARPPSLTSLPTFPEAVHDRTTPRAGTSLPGGSPPRATHHRPAPPRPSSFSFLQALRAGALFAAVSSSSASAYPSRSPASSTSATSSEPIGCWRIVALRHLAVIAGHFDLSIGSVLGSNVDRDRVRAVTLSRSRFGSPRISGSAWAPPWELSRDLIAKLGVNRLITTLCRDRHHRAHHGTRTG